MRGRAAALGFGRPPLALTPEMASAEERSEAERGAEAAEAAPAPADAKVEDLLQLLAKQIKDDPSWLKENPPVGISIHELADKVKEERDAAGGREGKGGDE